MSLFRKNVSKIKRNNKNIRRKRVLPHKLALREDELNFQEHETVEMLQERWAGWCPKVTGAPPSVRRTHDWWSLTHGNAYIFAVATCGKFGGIQKLSGSGFEVIESQHSILSRWLQSVHYGYKVLSLCVINVHSPLYFDSSHLPMSALLIVPRCGHILSLRP